MPRLSTVVLATAACLTSPVTASMPQCTVSTEPVGNSKLLARVLGSTVAIHETDSSTQCAELCVEDSDCAAFVLDVLSESPKCTLHAAPNTAHATLHEHKHAVRGGTPRLHPRRLLAPATAVAVGLCRDHDQWTDADDMPLLLGMDYFQKGINVINDTVNRSKSIRLPVYNFNYDKGTSYFNPYTSVAYKVPDEVSFTVNEAGYEQIDSLYSDVYTASIAETTKRYSYTIGIQMDFGNIGAGVTYSDNKQWYNFNLEEHERMNYNSHSVMWWKFYEAMAYPFDILGANSLDPMLKSYLDQLPPTIVTPADQAKYQRLIDNWGTSYVTWSNFGGGLNLDIFTNGSFDRSQTQQWNSDQHSLAFHFHLYDIDPSASIAGFTNKSQIHVNQSFNNASRVELFYEGGDPTLMDETSLTGWLASVQGNPHWLNVTYQKLSKLPNLNPTTAATLDQFILDYVKEALKGKTR